MSRKDYQLLAGVIYRRRQTDGSLANVDTALADLAWTLADVLADDNPSFDRRRFVEACETGKGTR